MACIQSTPLFEHRALSLSVRVLQELLTQVGFPCSAIFGSMDFEARKLALERFRMGKVKYMVVTDVAARGIDVPLLDFVINYSFPPAAKLFVHRVRRDTTAFGTQQNDSHLRSPQHLTVTLIC